MTSSLTRVSGESEVKERKSSSSCFILMCFINLYTLVTASRRLTYPSVS